MGQNDDNQTFKEKALQSIRERRMDREKEISFYSSLMTDTLVLKKLWGYGEPNYYKPNTKTRSVYGIEALRSISKSEAASISSLRIEIEFSDALRHKVDLSNFSNLEFLEIGNTTYAPYDLSGLRNLKTLVFLRVYDLIELPSFSGLEQLEHLVIHGANEIKGIPEELYSLTRLKTLKIAGVDGDSISHKIGRLTDLESLAVSTSSLRIPRSISELSKLKELELPLTSRPPYEEIYKLKNLRFLKFNPRHASSFKGINKLENLETLSLYKPETLTEEIGDLKHLKALQITIFHGDYPKSFARLTNLSLIIFGSNNSLSKLPSFFNHLKKLEFIHISQWEKLSSFDDKINELESLKLFELVYNPLITEIPSNLIEIKDAIVLKNRN